MSVPPPTAGPERIFLNGHIRLSADDPELVAGLAVRDGTVVATGSTDELRALAGPGTERIDLGGAYALPAFIESHTHFHRGAVLEHLYLDLDRKSVV